MSMKPGATTRPLASITRPAAPFIVEPIAAIASPLIARSARYHGAPVPSITRPPRTMRSYRGGCAAAVRARAPATAAPMTKRALGGTTVVADDLHPAIHLVVDEVRKH